nr:hypothetical protein [Rhodobacter sp.]
NSLTALAAVRAVTSVLAERGGSLEGTTVSVVGAAGAIGRGIALLAARGGARITLIGRPGTTHQSLDRLAAVAEECARAHSESARPEVTTDAEAALPAAEVVFTATNAVTPFLETRALRRNAVVCDVSRPYNLIDRLDVRPDLSLLRGGVVQAPDGAELDALAEPDLSTAIVACAAETIVLTLSGYDGAHLCGQLDLDEILRIGAAAEAAGFRLDADPSLTRR